MKKNKEFFETITYEERKRLNEYMKIAMENDRQDMRVDVRFIYSSEKGIEYETKVYFKGLCAQEKIDACNVVICRIKSLIAQISEEPKKA